jgi:L-lactate dehydrogenase (cytochrome)
LVQWSPGRKLGWVRSRWKRPLILKGIQDADDARQAAESGITCVLVSNHCGRQLDGTPSAARSLPTIAAAVGHRLTVIADGSLRSWLDAIRMLALGATGLLLGRAWAYALAAGGEAAVTHALTLMEVEMRVALSLIGCTQIRDVNREILASEIMGAPKSE